MKGKLTTPKQLAARFAATMIGHKLLAPGYLRRLMNMTPEEREEVIAELRRLDAESKNLLTQLLSL